MTFRALELLIEGYAKMRRRYCDAAKQILFDKTVIPKVTFRLRCGENTSLSSYNSACG